ncbi:hypothetical protein R83H12_02593 [Fibrobacteria bacterium R8-3-H12]
MRKIVLFSLLALFIASCNEKAAKTTNLEVIFSTKDLESAKWLSPDEYPLKAVGHDGKIYDNVDYLIKLPDYNGFEIVIWSTPAGDDVPYILYVVKEKIIPINTGLNISPHWSEPGNDENNYLENTFKIYKDYTIEINTEEKRENSDVQKYTKYYRINDKGDFYEVNP